MRSSSSAATRCTSSRSTVPEARNALNAAVAEQVAAAVDELDGSDELRVGVLTGAGGFFSAGMDLKAFLRGEAPAWSPAEAWDRQQEVIAPVFTSEDAREGAAAFAERRAPEWRGR